MRLNPHYPGFYANGLATAYLLFEFYQMNSQNDQSSEMLNGCLDHPLHPSP